MPDIADSLDAYLVGGAVRDALLGLPVGERDWVVVGATPEQMLRIGFKPVGAEFPVFLHPTSNEEYALARRERKTRAGYHGFDVVSDPTITLEQDLSRRDLRINAMARSRAGELIDPFGGARDIEEKCLRHVSPAFAEDPVRVLRVAKFAARFAAMGFVVADETMALMRQICEAGEVDALTPERVWRELHAAMRTPDLAVFVRTLRDCGALEKILPEIDALFGVPQVAKHHPEIDSGVHLLMALDAIQKTTLDARVVFAVLLHDVGKGVTPADMLPSHKGHEMRGLPLVEAVCDRLRAPAAYRQLAHAVCELHLLHHRFRELRAETMLKVLQKLDAFRRPQNVADFCLACAADLRGRLGHENQSVPQTELVARAHACAQNVDAAEIAAKFAGDGKQIANALRRARIDAIDKEKKSWTRAG